MQKLEEGEDGLVGGGKCLLSNYKVMTFGSIFVKEGESLDGTITD